MEKMRGLQIYALPKTKWSPKLVELESCALVDEKTLGKFFLCWLPPNSTRQYKFFYRCGTVIYIVVLILFIISQFLSMVVGKKNAVNFISSCPLFIASVNGLMKSCVIIYHQSDIVDLFNFMMSESGKPRDGIEKRIKLKSDRLCKLIGYFCVALATFIAVGFLITGLITRTGPLPSELLSLDANNDLTVAWFALVFGSIGTHMGMVLVASNILLAGLMIQMAAQLEFLKHRIQTPPPRNSKLLLQEVDFCRWRITKCVQHHQFIFKISKRLHRIFQLMMKAQMLMTFGNFATGVFQLVVAEYGSAEFFTTVFFLLHSFEEGCLYFWFANEVMQKSSEVSDAVYSVEWTDLSKNSKLDLLFIMIRAKRPIIFVTLFRIPLTVSAFRMILSTSYQAFALFREVAV